MFLIVIDLPVKLKKITEWKEFKLSVTGETAYLIIGNLKEWNVEWEFKFISFQNVELPESFSKDLRSLLELLLQRDIDKRLGCKGNG